MPSKIAQKSSQDLTSATTDVEFLFRLFCSLSNTKSNSDAKCLDANSNSIDDIRHLIEKTALVKWRHSSEFYQNTQLAKSLHTNFEAIKKLSLNSETRFGSTGDIGNSMKIDRKHLKDLCV